MGKGNRSVPVDAAKIDSMATNGLLGVSNSLAYRMHEIEKHFHSVNLPYGSDGAGPPANMVADSLVPWQITSGAGGAWGTEVVVHQGDVLNAIGPKTDIGRIFVVAVSQVGATYDIQFKAGSGAFGAADTLCGFYFNRESNVGGHEHLSGPCIRTDTTNTIWARCKCSADTKTLDFLLEVHVYAG